jgi:hypothetical protein
MIRSKTDDLPSANILIDYTNGIFELEDLSDEEGLFSIWTNFENNK